MSLRDEMRTVCVTLDKQRKPDSEGGFITVWVEGAKFMAVVKLNSSIEARAAEKQGVTGIYSVFTDKNATLEFHDVFRRLYDGKVFRVTSDGNDKATPDSSELNMRFVSAEEFELPTEGSI